MCLNAARMTQSDKVEIKRWGGRRLGSGRKTTGLKTITLRMSPVLQGLVRNEADRLGITISEFVSRAVQSALLQTLQANPLSGIPHHGSYRSQSQIPEEPEAGIPHHGRRSQSQIPEESEANSLLDEQRQQLFRQVVYVSNSFLDDEQWKQLFREIMAIFTGGNQ